MVHPADDDRWGDVQHLSKGLDVLWLQANYALVMWRWDEGLCGEPIGLSFEFLLAWIGRLVFPRDLDEDVFLPM